MRKARVSKLLLLTDAERHEQLVVWNATQVAYTPDQSLPQLVEAQAARQPDALALVCEAQHLTYGALNRQANQLAHHLRHLGVGPDVLVGLCVERSVAMVVGVLGILKAGGAYVPLDPTYPAARLAFMLADAQVALLVTQAALAAALPPTAARVLCLDTDEAAIARHPATTPPGGAGAENLAYVIYTSGSTGQPKGVRIAHRGVSNLAVAQQRLFAVPPGSRVLQFASMSFDSSVWEVLMALGSGATLCVGTPDAVLPGPALRRLVQEQAITHATLPPSVLAVLAPDDWPAGGTLIVAGEACAPSLVAHWAPGRPFFNAYGPTEATVCATIAACRDGSQPPPIGRPIANTQVYVLDRQGQVVPIGVPGEVYLGGEGLAQGYLHRPGLTGASFLPHPFSQAPGQRLYRTGDLGRYRPDGTLEFLGRRDQQVKIRGFRIELGESEAVLAQHPGVRETVVLARDDPAGLPRLVGYVLPAPDAVPTAEALHHFLAAHLPAYMLPTAFVWVAAWPLSPTGKVDRRALPAPDFTERRVPTAFVPPRTPAEALVATLWQEVLGVHQVGLEDNFFALGGHSLLATQLVSRLRHAFGVEVPVRWVFDAPTVAGLS